MFKNNFNKKFLYSPKFCNGEVISENYGRKYMKNIPSEEDIELCKQNSVILADDIFMSLDTNFTQRNLNTFVLGKPGHGKIRRFLVPNILQANTSFVFTDIKGELYDGFKDFLIEQGYKVKCVNLINLDDNFNYNPFNYIETEDDINELSECIYDNTGVVTDAFWRDIGILFLSACISYICEVFPKDKRCLKELCDFIMSSNIETLDELFYDLNNNFYAFKKYDIFRYTADNRRVIDTVISDVYHRIKRFQKNNFLYGLEDLELEKIATEKTALFIITSEIDTKYNAISDMIITQLTNISIKNKSKNNIHVRFYLDGFSTIGKIPYFSSKLMMSNALKISFCIMVNSIAEIENNYSLTEKYNIIEACDILLFAGMNETDKKYISKIVGVRTFQRIINKKFLFINEEKEISSSIDDYFMEIGKCFIIIRGFKSFETDLYDTEKHPNFSKLSKE